MAILAMRRQVREWVRDACVTVDTVDFGHDDLVSLEPFRLLCLGGDVQRVMDERLKRLHGFPVIDIADQSIA